MTKARIISALCAFFALCALFLKMPEIGSLVAKNYCRTCSSDHPYLVLLGAGYFAFLFSLIISCRVFPSLLWARLGLLFAVGLSVALTYQSTQICAICLFAHGCHIAMWVALLSTRRDSEPEQLVGVKLSSACACAASTIALFTTLNITFMLYSISSSQSASVQVKPGDTLTQLTVKTTENKAIIPDAYKAVIISFVAESCPYCKEQLVQLNTLSQRYAQKGFCFIAVSKKTTEPLRKLAPTLDWVEDLEASLFNQFGITGYPSLVVLNPKQQVQISTQGWTIEQMLTLDKQLEGMA